MQYLSALATIPLDADIDQLFQTFSVAAQKAPLVSVDRLRKLMCFDL